MHSKKAILIRHAIYALILAVYAAAMHFFEIHCPIAYIFGVPCPTCGMTRAMISLIRLDFAAYISYHPLALPMTLAIWFLIHLKLFKKKTLITVASLSVVVLNFLYYIWQLYSLFA